MEWGDGELAMRLVDGIFHLSSLTSSLTGSLTGPLMGSLMGSLMG